MKKLLLLFVIGYLYSCNDKEVYYPPEQKIIKDKLLQADSDSLKINVDSVKTHIVKL